MNTYKIALAILSTLASLVLSAQTYTGKVYSIQVSKKGVSKEVPLSDVVVTDGKSVTTTKADGTFVFETSSNPSYIAVTAPSGFSPSTFYHPIEGNSQQYRFLLDKVVEKKNGSTKFIVVNDLININNARWVVDLKQQAFYHDASFVVVTGKGGDTRSLELEKELGLPVYLATSGVGRTDGFPQNYSFIKGGVHFVVLSSSDSLQHPVLWLKSMLTNVGISTPSILITNSEIVKHDGDVLSAKGDSLHLSDFNVRAIVDGGSSLNLYDYTGKFTTSTICTAPLTSGGIDHSPAGFRLVSVTNKGSITTETVLTNAPDVATIVSPNDTAYIEDNKIRFYANVNGSSSPIRRVRIGISRDSVGYKWNDLNRVTAWTWSGFYVMVPADTAAQYSLKLEAFTESGQILTAEKNIVVSTRKDSSAHFKGIWGNLGGSATHNANVPIPFSGRMNHLWTANPQGSTLFSSPVIADSIVVTALTNDLAYNKSELAAFHVNTGKSLWHFFPKSAIKNTFVSNGRNLFTTDVLGNVYAIEMNTGMPVWQTTLNKSSYFYTGSALLDSLYFTGNEHGVTALRSTDGTVVWSMNSNLSSNRCESTLTIGDGILLSQNRMGELVGINAKTGSLVWTSTNVNRSIKSHSTSFSNGLFHVVSGDRYLAIEARSGAIITDVTLPDSASTKSIPLVCENVLIYGSINSGMVAFDLLNKKIRWKVDVGGALVNTLPRMHEHLKTVETSAVKIGNYIVFGASDGFLYVVRFDNGFVTQKITLGAPILSTIAITNDMLFVTDFSGNISAFRIMGE